MVDLSPLFKLLKGKDADNFKAVIEAYVKLYEQQDKKIDKLEKQLTEQIEINRDLRTLVQQVINMEERCLDQNVRNNEVIRNLAEWIIFTERREEIGKNIGKLLK